MTGEVVMDMGRVLEVEARHPLSQPARRQCGAVNGMKAEVAKRTVIRKVRRGI
jgi:hypothetical protein